ncbi:hypothetical protein [Nocardioides sp. GY 10127]|uniref:hypothetical protein n=1 Tax=Nocardioides sp. GY 10127 TaxID=2569762 RepID=UPI0010A897F2|nr:hypothetical protein [Nocardioides sp. GY 10127]TIC79147.1 hypothetical protein E8D37_18120 [Nocardioides sp. GY 10127]
MESWRGVWRLALVLPVLVAVWGLGLAAGRLDGASWMGDHVYRLRDSLAPVAVLPFLAAALTTRVRAVGPVVGGLVVLALLGGRYGGAGLPTDAATLPGVGYLVLAGALFGLLGVLWSAHSASWATWLVAAVPMLEGPLLVAQADERVAAWLPGVGARSAAFDLSAWNLLAWTMETALGVLLLTWLLARGRRGVREVDVAAPLSYEAWVAWE